MPGASLVTAALTVGCGAGATSQAVDAPMISVDAAAAAVALATATPAAPDAAPRTPIDTPFQPGERWSGTYTCTQGKTDLVITFEDVARTAPGGDPDVEALFEFHYDGGGMGGHPPVDGSGRMRGTYDPKTRRLRLEGYEWIDQPANYGLATFTGTVSRTTSTFSGTVQGPGCTVFMVTKRP